MESNTFQWKSLVTTKLKPKGSVVCCKKWFFSTVDFSYKKKWKQSIYNLKAFNSSSSALKWKPIKVEVQSVEIDWIIVFVKKKKCMEWFDLAFQRWFFKSVKIDKRLKVNGMKISQNFRFV